MQFLELGWVWYADTLAVYYKSDNSLIVWHDEWAGTSSFDNSGGYMAVTCPLYIKRLAMFAHEKSTAALEFCSSPPPRPHIATQIIWEWDKCCILFSDRDYKTYSQGSCSQSSTVHGWFEVFLIDPTFDRLDVSWEVTDLWRRFYWITLHSYYVLWVHNSSRSRCHMFEECSSLEKACGYHLGRKEMQHCELSWVQTCFEFSS